MTDRVLVVGAGPGGVSASRWLAELDIEHDVVERNSDLGGIWDIGFPGSPMYESAHFISSRTLSGFRDLPMPAEYPDYPSHRQILTYLRAYADKHGVRARTELGRSVAQVLPASDGAFDVRLDGGETRRYAGVILATGQQWLPRQASLPGRFEGELMHSSAYKSARQLEGKRVLIVGGGNSACDIAVDAGIAAARALLSLRRGYWFIPKHIFGVPADVFGDSEPQLPGWLEQLVFQPMLRLLVGDLARFGLPRPDHRLFETHPVLNSQLLHSLSHGDVTVKGELRGLAGRNATFADGSVEELDLVILATGYRRSIPILSEAVHREGDVSQLFLNVFHRSHPGLFVVGHFETDGGAYPLIDLQCELIARVLRARREKKSQLSAFERRLAGPAPDFSAGVRFLAVERMSNYLRTHPYKHYLERAIQEL